MGGGGLGETRLSWVASSHLTLVNNQSVIYDSRFHLKWFVFKFPKSMFFSLLFRVQLSESLTKLQDYAQSTSQTLTPYAETISNQFLENTKQLRERVMTDVEDMRSRLEPHRVELYGVLQKHIDEYREKMEPIFTEYANLNRENADQLRAKLQPLLEEMRQQFETNVEETKSKLVPMVEAVRTKLTERLEELRTMAAPYAEEYKEQLMKVVEEAREKLAPHTQDLQTRMEPYMENARARFAQVYETIYKAVQA